MSFKLESETRIVIGRLAAPTHLDGPHPASLLALYKDDERAWQAWGGPTSEQWQSARLVPLPPPEAGSA